MGKTTRLYDESYRAARLVVRHFEARLDDAEILESSHIVREIVAFTLQRFLERHERELHRLAKKVSGCHE